VIGWVALGLLLLITALAFLGAAKWRRITLNNRLVEAAYHPTTSVDQIEALLRRGADPNARRMHFPQRVSLLDPDLHAWLRNPQDFESVTALCAAASQGRADLVKVLLDAGADPRVTSGERYGRLPVLLHWAQARPPTGAANGREIVGLLLDHGADVNGGTPWGSTPLMAAVSTHDADTVRLMLERGANPNARDSMGRTALRRGFGDGTMKTASVRALLEHGADVNARDVEGLTPLGRARRAKASQEVLTMLRRAGANE
jgi:ankyrin repeat protein